MYPYLLIFVLTTILIYLSEKAFYKKNSYFWGISAVIIISVFAGMRAVSVGTDTASYLLEYNRACNRIGNFWWLYKVDNVFDIELSFILIDYITAHFRSGFFLLLFVYAIITNGFIYFAIRNEYVTKQINMWFPWIVYCTMFYNATLNNMRQWVSLAIIYYAFSNREKISLKRIIILCSLATFFHYSGVVGFLLYGIAKYNSERLRLNKLVRDIILLFSIMIPFLLPYVISFLITNVISSNRYGGFVLGNSANADVMMDKLTFSIRLILVFGYWCMYYSKRRNITQDDRFDLFVSVMDVAFALQYNQLNLRIGNYFSIFELHYLPLALRTYSPNKISRRIAVLLYIIVLLIYWYIKFILWNHNETHPYLIGL